MVPMHAQKEYEERIETQDGMTSPLHDRVWTTSALWALAAVLLSVWTLGLVTSVTLDGGIHLAFAAAIVLMLAAWLRRARRQVPMTMESRPGRGPRSK
jgi:hypothetical protein